MCPAGTGLGDADEPGEDGDPTVREPRVVFSSLLEDDAEELYDNAPCGYLSTLMDGEIAKVNGTLLGWLGYRREELVGVRRFTDLLTGGGRLYHETHYAPMLRLHGEVRELALDLVAADGRRLPALVTAKVKVGEEGQPLLVRVTVFDARERRAYEQELLAAKREAERERERLAKLTGTLQRTLLPDALPDVDGAELAAHYHVASSDQVGGDFYDVFPLGGDRWGFFLGDVCGKGPEAAVLTSLTRYALRAAAVRDPDPVVVLTTLNTVMLQQRRPGAPRFCTVIFGLLEPDGDGFAVTIAGGGHPPPLVLRAGGEVDFLATPGGQLVGLLPGARFTRARTRLGPGDVVVLYTDGLTEARRADGAMLEEEGLAEAAATMTGKDAPTVVDLLVRLLTDWSQSPSDDTAILAIGNPGAASPEARCST
ncbi:PP2C family protein-serine/threonine phosphatase [Saccharothrix texasensis]|uniref:Sigma-B regulation protein RsbU (Phosphoserine phosphatase) n=1 Tax=Saccharothrix texasensis TaxID=103734 RepID=A0A3N1HHR4_9PSEU|nr:SpoIIE family protein phosphatase [Saccharothrix texasensis]ROP42063.1 sigma-B regulation protein RsbU (phosphoserine phosphatase) [Saccharothrix texasensis]